MRFASYMRENYQWVMTRHLDNLGFKSGAAAPPWDERRLPCKNTFK
jgi:hypothetical protein